MSQPSSFSTKDVDRSKKQVQETQQKADRVTEHMSRNVQEMRQQGEKLEKLHGQTSQLQEASGQFRSTARKARSKAFWNNMKWLLLVLLLLLGIAALVGYKIYSATRSTP